MTRAHSTGYRFIGNLFLSNTVVEYRQTRAAFPKAHKLETNIYHRKKEPSHFTVQLPFNMERQHFAIFLIEIAKQIYEIESTANVYQFDDRITLLRVSFCTR